MSKKDSQRCFRNYAIYSLSVMLLVLFLTISFDMATGNYKETCMGSHKTVTQAGRNIGQSEDQT